MWESVSRDHTFTPLVISLIHVPPTVILTLMTFLKTRSVPKFYITGDCTLIVQIPMALGVNTSDHLYHDFIRLIQL